MKNIKDFAIDYLIGFPFSAAIVTVAFTVSSPKHWQFYAILSVLGLVVATVWSLLRKKKEPR